MNHLAEYFLIGAAVLFAADLAYVIPQYLVARTLGLPIGTIRIWGFVYTASTGKIKFAGFSRALMGARVHVLKKNPLKRGWEYACVYASGFVVLGACELVLLGAFLMQAPSRTGNYSYLRLMLAEVFISLVFYVQQGLAPGGDIKGLRLSWKYGWGGIQYGAMVRIGAAVHPKGRYKDLSASDIEIISHRVRNAEAAAKMAWFRLSYFLDRGEERAALDAARQALAILEESPEVVEFRKAMIHSIAFTEAWVTKSPDKAFALLQSVGPPDKDTMRSGLLAECAVAASRPRKTESCAKTRL